MTGLLHGDLATPRIAAPISPSTESPHQPAMWRVPRIDQATPADGLAQVTQPMAPAWPNDSGLDSTGAKSGWVRARLRAEEVVRHSGKGADEGKRPGGGGDQSAGERRVPGVTSGATCRAASDSTGHANDGVQGAS